MKRAIPWVAAVAASVVFSGCGAKAPKTAAPGTASGSSPAASQAANPRAADGAEKIAYTFEDDAKLREFADLWQRRQIVALHMTVLQGYWNGEQAAVAKLNTDLQTQYGFDPMKNYALDTEKRVLMERAAAAPAGQEQPAAAPADQGAPAHTFANEEEMKVFATVWQQRQNTGVRVAALQSLWDEQKKALDALNQTITSTYHLDTTKNYALNAERRVLIEQPAPVAPVATTPQSMQPASQTP